MPVKLKSNFKLASRFTPQYSDETPIFICEDGNIICGRNGEEKLEIYEAHVNQACEPSYINEKLDDTTVYVANPADNTIIFATKKLFLCSVDRSSRKIIKMWNSTHSKVIGTMALNTSGTRLATGSSDCTIRIWHIGAKEGFVASCRSHSSKITLLRFHPSKPLLFSCGLGEVEVVVWDTETGGKCGTLLGHQGNVTDIAFSPVDTIVATCGHDKVAILWSSDSFERVKTIPVFESLQSVAYIPPGALKDQLGAIVNETSAFLLTGGQWGILRVWDVETSRCVLELRGPTAFSSNTAALKNLDFGLHSISRILRFYVPAFGKNNEVVLVTRNSSHVEIYNAHDLRLFSEFVGEIGSVDQLCLMGASGNRLVLADASANFKLFAHPPGPTPSSATDGVVDDHSWACQLVSSPHTGIIGDMAASPCGQWLLTGGHDQAVCLWQLSESEGVTVRPKLLPKSIVKGAHEAHISAVCFSRDKSCAFSASTDGVLKAWNVNLEHADVESPTTACVDDTPAVCLQEAQSIRGAHDGAVNCIHVSVNGKLLATASRDKTAKVWSLETSPMSRKINVKLVGALVGHSRGVWSVQFSDYERVLLTASGDKDLRLWNLKDMTCLRTFEGHEDPVYRAVFISKGRQILSCDQRGLVRLWNLSKGKKNETTSDDPATSPSIMEAHQGRVWTIAVCPGETGFYTGGEDATICFFKDTSDETLQGGAASVEEFIKTHQEFENLLRSKKYRRALRLAIKLDKPQKAFEILQEICLLEGLSSSGPNSGYLEKSLFQLMPRKPTVDGEAPSEEMVQRLLKYSVNWNTRARTCLVAQRVFNWIISNWAPERVLKWPGITKTIEAFIPYTVRHFQRLNRLEQQMSVLDYLFAESRYSQIRELSKSAQEGETQGTTTLIGLSAMEVDEPNAKSVV